MVACSQQTSAEEDADGGNHCFDDKFHEFLAQHKMERVALEPPASTAFLSKITYRVDGSAILSEMSPDTIALLLDNPVHATRPAMFIDAFGDLLHEAGSKAFPLMWLKFNRGYRHVRMDLEQLSLGNNQPAMTVILLRYLMRSSMRPNRLLCGEQTVPYEFLAIVEGAQQRNGQTLSLAVLVFKYVPHPVYPRLTPYCFCYTSQAPFLKGPAYSGKSTLVTRMRRAIVDSADQFRLNQFVLVDESTKEHHFDCAKRQNQRMLMYPDELSLMMSKTETRTCWGQRDLVKLIGAPHIGISSGAKDRSMRSHHASGVAPCADPCSIFTDESFYKGGSYRRVLSVLTEKGCGAISDDLAVQKRLLSDQTALWLAETQRTHSQLELLQVEVVGADEVALPQRSPTQSSAGDGAMGGTLATLATPHARVEYAAATAHRVSRRKKDDRHVDVRSPCLAADDQTTVVGVAPVPINNRRRPPLLTEDFVAAGAEASRRATFVANASAQGHFAPRGQQGATSAAAAVGGAFGDGANPAGAQSGADAPASFPAAKKQKVSAGRKSGLTRLADFPCSRVEPMQEQVDCAADDDEPEHTVWGGLEKVRPTEQGLTIRTGIVRKLLGIAANHKRPELFGGLIEAFDSFAMVAAADRLYEVPGVPIAIDYTDYVVSAALLAALLHLRARSELASVAGPATACEADLLAFAKKIATHLASSRKDTIAPAQIATLVKKDKDFKIIDSAAKASHVLNHMHRLGVIDQASEVGERGRYLPVAIPADFMQRVQRLKKGEEALISSLLAQQLPHQHEP